MVNNTYIYQVVVCGV